MDFEELVYEKALKVMADRGYTDLEITQISEGKIKGHYVVTFCELHQDRETNLPSHKSHGLLCGLIHPLSDPPAYAGGYFNIKHKITI